MRLAKAKKAAEQMKIKIQQDCYVIKIKRKFCWYKPGTWFAFYENVSKDYVDFHATECKIYYKTK